MLNIIHKKSIGVDIADRTIEVVELVKSAGWAKVRSFGRIKLAAGIVERGRIKDEKKLTLALKKALLSAGPKPIKAGKIIFGLPESQIYTHIFRVKRKPGLTPKEIDIQVQKEAFKNIPLRDNQMVFSYRTLFKTKSEIFIVLLATEKKIVSEWRNFFKSVDLEVEVFDIETLANFRGLDIKDRKKTVCLIDIGSKQTNISIFYKKGLYYSYVCRPAGDDFTAAIAKNLKVDEDTAEKLKINAGLNKAKEKIYPLLTEGLDQIIKEIKSSVKYFEETFQAPVEEIILIGGGSRLKGLVEYLKPNFDLPISLGRSKFFKDVNFEYIEAAGLARRGLDKRWDKKDPFIPILDKRAGKKEAAETLAVEPKKISRHNLILTPETEKEDKPRNLKKDLIFLAAIILAGLVLIGLAFGWRQIDRQKREDKKKSQVQEYSQPPEEKINEEVPREGDLEENLNPDEALEPEENPEEVSLPAEEPKEEPKPSVIISDTETGWLNVRQGPGASYEIIAKVQPSEVYEVVEEKTGWIKIQLSADSQGWISAKYAEKFIE